MRAELNVTGRYLGDDIWEAVCTTCGQLKALPLKDWTADHIIPVAAGGTESGPLRLSCADCQRRQGGLEARRRQLHHG